MNLTQLTFNPRSAQARRDLADAYEMHRTLSRVFANTKSQPPWRFVWRQERDINPWTCPTVLVQSRFVGDWEVLKSLPAYLQNPPKTKSIDLERYVRAGKYRFRLVANPTVSRMGKRRGLTKTEEQIQWLGRQGSNHGFTVTATVVSAADLFESKRKENAHITVQRVAFDGLLEVQQPERVRHVLLNGLGRAKAFGCGLLSLVLG